MFYRVHLAVKLTSSFVMTGTYYIHTDIHTSSIYSCGDWELEFYVE